MFFFEASRQDCSTYCMHLLKDFQNFFFAITLCALCSGFLYVIANCSIEYRKCLLGHVFKLIISLEK